MLRNGIETLDQSSPVNGGACSNATAADPRLKVALSFDPATSQAWLSRIIEAVGSSGRATVDLLIICDWRSPSHKRERDPVLFRAWRWFDRWLFADRRSTRESSAELASTPKLGLGEQDFTGSRLSHLAHQQLEAASLDLIIDVGAEECFSELASCARYGSWRIPDPTSDSSDRAWFWTMYQNVSAFESTLNALSPSAQSITTSVRSFAATDLLSLSRNRRTKERKSCELLRHKLETFQPLSVLAPRTTIEDQRLESARRSSKPIVPGNSHVAKFLCKWTLNAGRHALRRHTWKEHWFIAYRRNLGSLPSSESDMQNFQIVTSAKDRFYADPFCIDREGKSYLFFEDYPFDKGQGLISFVEIDNSGKCSAPEIALKREYHLSYPHVFEHGGEIYMVPESLECRRVDLYRATDFPRNWILEKTLIDNIEAVDPTILFHNDKVWLFVSGVRSKECINEELFLFFSDSLLGQWRPHPCNPIVSDVRKARPAGRICFHDGKIIRPAQDCSQSYGRAITFHQIDALTETTYHETPIATIGPGWHATNLGTHTFNQSELIQTVDGRVWRRKYRGKRAWRAVWNRLPLQEYVPSVASCEPAISRQDSSKPTHKPDAVLIDPAQEKRYAAELMR